MRVYLLTLCSLKFHQFNRKRSRTTNKREEKMLIKYHIEWTYLFQRFRIWWNLHKKWVQREEDTENERFAILKLLKNIPTLCYIIHCDFFTEHTSCLWIEKYGALLPFFKVIFHRSSRICEVFGIWNILWYSDFLNRYGCELRLILCWIES